MGLYFVLYFYFPQKLRAFLFPSWTESNEAFCKNYSVSLGPSIDASHKNTCQKSLSADF